VAQSILIQSKLTLFKFFQILDPSPGISLITHSKSFINPIHQLIIPANQSKTLLKDHATAPGISLKALPIFSHKILAFLHKKAKTSTIPANIEAIEPQSQTNNHAIDNTIFCISPPSATIAHLTLQKTFGTTANQKLLIAKFILDIAPPLQYAHAFHLFSFSNNLLSVVSNLLLNSSTAAVQLSNSFLAFVKANFILSALFATARKALAVLTFSQNNSCIIGIVKSPAFPIHDKTSAKVLALSLFQSFLNCSIVLPDTSANNHKLSAEVLTAVSIFIPACVICVQPDSAFIHASTKTVDIASKSALEKPATLHKVFISLAIFRISPSLAL